MSLRLRVACALLAGAAFTAGCAGGERVAAESRDDQAPPANGQLFTRLPSSYTGVRFENRLEDTQELNVFTYRHFYNGGGIALGDLNGDGLPEIVLTASQGATRLYLNEGNFRFRDVTEASGLGRAGAWATGLTIADVNGDGRLDVYISHAGKRAGRDRANALYINRGQGEDGVPTFSDEAERYGVADQGYGTQGAFLDYDGDGDLDLFLINNSPSPVSSFGLRNARQARDSLPGNRLLRNDGGRFTDVSEAAGIYGSEIAFALGVAVGDVNRDGWPDIYVANDFFERDYLYLNRGDGTFTEALDRQMSYMSYFSMGMDIADVNNDGWPDIYTTDMLPEDEFRLKSTSTFEGWDVYQAKVRNGYHHQLMRNMLQVSNGDGTFSEVGQMAGVARSDWSWSALLADLDLDGHKDIFVTNGLAKDITSQDYVAFLANQATMNQVTKGTRVDFKQLADAMGSTPIANYAFHNRGDLTFVNASSAWGLDAPSFSSGAAYGDLDGDGTLDLVVNNVNQEAFVYRNNSRTLHPGRGWLQVALEGEGGNRYGIGAKVTVWNGDRAFLQEQAPTRGFQSSVDHTLTFGLGEPAGVDSLRVEWPDGRVEVVASVEPNTRLVARQGNARPQPRRTPQVPTPLLAEVDKRAVLPFVHRENDFVDFDRERLTPKLLSTEGPYMAVGDVNGDGLDDLYIGGARGQAGALLVQQPDGRFVAGSASTFEADSVSEDLGALLFDADGDGDLDLYVVSGGSDYSDLAPALQDRLYLNDGRGNFTKGVNRLPGHGVSGSRVVAADYDGDGDLDLFVGGRVVPGRYGEDPRSSLLRNDGKGRFTDVTDEVAPGLSRVGMVTDAVWQDVDRDGRPDLVLVGEWLPITVFRNAGGGRLVAATVPGLERSHGWWNRVVAGDFTGDGRVDFLVGNLGLNTRLKATPEEPTTMLVKDFDGNGFAEQILACYNQGVQYPVVMRDDLLKAIPSLKVRYLNYQDYARKTLAEVFSPEELEGAIEKRAYTFATSLARNNGDGSFTLVPLPREAQLFPVYGILADDVDGDGLPDLLLAGNLDGVKPELGRMSAGYGLFLRGDGKGGFSALPGLESGFVVQGAGRDVRRVRTRGEGGGVATMYVVTRNDDRPVAFRPTIRE